MQTAARRPLGDRTEESMAKKTYQPGENYHYPLILKKLLKTPLIYSPDQEIVYNDKNRYTYRTLNERINRLADGLKKLGVAKGDIVAVFDYDSHRYLECFFAIPMMGAVPSDDKLAPVERTDPLHPEPCGGESHHCPC
jgi:non-ribosomal peptide synthetase component E (peptide arylation enzyme)